MGETGSGNPFGDTSGSSVPFGTDTTGGAPAGDFGFTNPSAAPAPSTAGAAGTPTAEKDPDPIVRLLRESPPSTPADMADAFTWVSRLQRWDEVGRLLDRVASLNWNDEQKAQLAREAGPALWVRLSSGESEWSDAQRSLLKEIASAPSRLARAPEWLDRWVNALSSESAGERELAQLRLQDAGSAGIQRLLNHLLDGDTKVPGGLLAQAVARFGREGQDALRAAVLVDDAERAGRAVLALAATPGKAFTAELGAGLYNQVLGDADRQQLAQTLSSKYASLPTEQAVHDFLASTFDNQLTNYFIARQKPGFVEEVVWSLTPDGLSVQPKSVSASRGALERVRQLAILRTRLSLVTQSDAIAAATALLQGAYQDAPELEQTEADVGVGVMVPANTPQLPEFWRAVFEQANDWQMHGAALRALQAYATALPPGSVVPQLLSDLLDDPRPMIRYSALEAVSHLDPQEAYAGAEQALRTAIEMATLGNGPHVLVVGSSPDLRQAAAQQLRQQVGAEISQAPTAREALRLLAANRPVELILVVDRVGDLSLYEMLQRIRNSAKGQSLPLAVLTDKLYQHERQWISETGGVVKSVLSRDAEHTRRVVTQMQDTLDTQPLTLADRGWFAQVGSRFLARVTGDREAYAFYPVDQWQRSLKEIAEALPAPSQTSMLVGLGSQDSQLDLFALAADPNREAAERVAAANAFSDSVRRHGMLLQREDVARSYEVYNQLGPTDDVAVRALGHILDVIEAQAGQLAQWPKPLP